MSAAIVAHGGGPTAVLNASLAGAIAEARCHPEITSILGARFGVRGLTEERFVPLDGLTDGDLEKLRLTPGSAIGSSRLELPRDKFETLFEIFDRHRVRFFFYTGGN